MLLLRREEESVFRRVHVWSRHPFNICAICIVQCTQNDLVNCKYKKRKMFVNDMNSCFVLKIHIQKFAGM